MIPNGSAIREKAFSRVQPGDLRKILQELRSGVLEDVDIRLQESIDRMVTKLEVRHTQQPSGLKEKSSSTKECQKREELRTKEFAFGRPAVAYLWENPSMRSLYNAVFAMFLLLYFYIGVFYYFNTEMFENNMAVLFWTFGQFHVVAATWLGIVLSIVFILHPVFRFWATNRTSVKKKGVYDFIFCTSFILYEAALILIPAAVIIASNLPPISSFFLSLEQMRLFMKSYAFVRENIPRTLKYKLHQDGDQDDSDSCLCPKVDKLVYFLFAPTLIYRDSYPRTSVIRWRHVGWNILLFAYTTAFYYIPLIWFPVNTFRRAGIEPMPVGDFIGALMQATLVGPIIMIGAFYKILYAIQETFGELLRFGDRRFTGDVWNSTSYNQFFRSWNLIVHDWLYTYIYRDIYVVWGRRRTCAMLTVFLISAVVHEYILAVTLKFLFPLNFILFTAAGVPFVLMTRKTTSSFGNFFIWITMFIGYGILLVFYSLEWYARRNCPSAIDSWQDFFVPRMFYCDLISWPS